MTQRGATIGRSPVRCEHQIGWLRAGRRRWLSAPGCGLVRSDNARRDSAPFTDGDALPQGPGADIGAVLAACPGPRGPARLPSPNSAGVPGEGSEPRTKLRGVLLIQVNLVLVSSDAKPHGLIRRPAIQIVFQGDGNPLRHAPLPAVPSSPHSTDQGHAAPTATRPRRSSMLGGNQICPLAAIRKAPQFITDGSQTPGPAAPGLHRTPNTCERRPTDEQLDRADMCTLVEGQGGCAFVWPVREACRAGGRHVGRAACVRSALATPTTANHF